MSNEYTEHRWVPLPRHTQEDNVHTQNKLATCAKRTGRSVGATLLNTWPPVLAARSWKNCWSKPFALACCTYGCVGIPCVCISCACIGMYVFHVYVFHVYVFHVYASVCMHQCVCVPCVCIGVYISVCMYSRCMHSRCMYSMCSWDACMSAPHILFPPTPPPPLTVVLP